jgi:putative hydrolase of the HAD superfamily
MYALARAGVRAEETIYVGDSYLADVLGSRGAGLHPVLIDREGKAPKVDARVIRSLLELVDVVGEL